jgi:hypothetical protein
MSRSTPEQIIAHVALLRAVDRLLEQAQVVRQRRETLERLLTPAPSVEGASITDPKQASAGRRSTRAVE